MSECNLAVQHRSGGTQDPLSQRKGNSSVMVWPGEEGGEAVWALCQVRSGGRGASGGDATSQGVWTPGSPRWSHGPMLSALLLVRLEPMWPRLGARPGPGSGGRGTHLVDEVCSLSGVQEHGESGREAKVEKTPAGEGDAEHRPQPLSQRPVPLFTIVTKTLLEPTLDRLL